MGEGNREALPETVTIGGVVLRWYAPHEAWRAEDGSLAWRYADDDTDPIVRGRFGCSIRLGGAEVGGVADALDALDALVWQRVREVLLPMVDLLLRRANAARLHGDHAQADALMRDLESAAMRIPLAPNVVVVDEDTRRALPDACDVDEPAEGDAFSAAYAAHERADSDRSPRSASVFPGGAP